MKEALLTTGHIELVGKKKFAAVVLDPEYEIDVVQVGSVNSNALSSSSPLNVHLSRKPQIVSLIAEEAPTKVSAKYLDFADVFSQTWRPNSPNTPESTTMLSN